MEWKKSALGSGSVAKPRLRRPAGMPGRTGPRPGLYRGSRLLDSRMIEPEDLVEGEWADWYRLTPLERWQESEKLWETYLALGGSLDPEPDTQSPFFDAEAPRPVSADGRPGLRVLRRGGV
jgi:hypothetical protein